MDVPVLTVFQAVLCLTAQVHLIVFLAQLVLVSGINLNTEKKMENKYDEN